METSAVFAAATMEMTIIAAAAVRMQMIAAVRENAERREGSAGRNGENPVIFPMRDLLTGRIADVIMTRPEEMIPETIPPDRIFPVLTAERPAAVRIRTDCKYQVIKIRHSTSGYYAV